VVLLHYNLLVNGMALVEEHRISSDQRMMCVLPIHHVSGIVMSLITPLYAGGGTVLCQRFSAERFLERISGERIHIVSVVPTMLQFLLRAKLNMAAYKMVHFRHLICGGGPLSVDLASRFEQTFGWRVIPGYGLSESTCYSSFLPTDLPGPEHRAWMGDHGFPSVGVPLSVNEMGIVDSSGRRLGEGERGEIVIRGHNVMSHYEQEPEATAAVFAHGWLHSGDEGFYLTDQQNRQFFFITGRLKEIIVRGGRNISPFEIDEVLQALPGVHAGLAVGFENEWYGEEVGAVIAPKPTVVLSEDQVLSFCRKHLPFDKSPKVVVFTDSIPEDSTGKYLRGECRKLFHRWKETEFRES
jgi:long-chain acyl-CoA synthetase